MNKWENVHFHMALNRAKKDSEYLAVKKARTSELQRLANVADFELDRRRKGARRTKAETP